MDAPSIPSYLQDSYTLKFSCLTDTYNDNCLISWTKDGQLLNANGEVTNKIHDSAVMEFAVISKENNSQTITCSVNCSNFDVQLSKSHTLQIPSSTQKTYETPNESKDTSLTNSNDIPMVWIVIANVQENETVGMNEEVTYAQVNKIRTNRTETVEPKTKEGSDTNLVYADIDIEHLETASKPPSRQRPPSPTEYADVDFIRTKRGSKSDNIIT
ncbi:hypothetical protein MAR_028775 [Mya arenaria]|uniref:Ig-like domain-containing protein n=1 Tax=Mya arenaria TaxID=6604 RepID=A0ABY7DIC3_MYAAR|nr:hypothetical protein MAR_028775 [Mya arenaria]